MLAIAESIQPHPAMIAPFATLLLAIAAMPFICKHWWEHHYSKVAVVLGLVTIVYYAVVLGHPERMLHVAFEYVSFIALIGSLFVVCGGIHIQIKGKGTPPGNVLFLLFGAVLANFIGTTGASMLLIRPWIRLNQSRIGGFHVVFFIFIVSNTGGALTPIGDPPLFLGYLKGVPFWWVIQNCWLAWLIVVGLLLTVFYIVDLINFRAASKGVHDREATNGEWKFDGGLNLFFLTIIIAGVFTPAPYREFLMIGAGIGSYFFSGKSVHEANDFSFGPIKEVAWLFFGIFATMVPALDYLGNHASTLGIRSAMQFYWWTGILSGVLDNAPTYLTFLAAAFGLEGLNLNQTSDVALFVKQHDHYLTAISLGAVFFGALTYIGNGPNFMVKSIAERAKIETPDFFSYIWKYALPTLVPICALVGVLFFSRFKVF